MLSVPYFASLGHAERLGISLLFLWVLWFQVSAQAPVPVPRLFPTYDTCLAYTQTMDNRAIGAPGQTVRYWCTKDDTAA